MKLKKIDVALISVLFFLIVVEFVVKSKELSSFQVLVGIVIGFSIGFKLSAVHGSTVSRQAIELARTTDNHLSVVSSESEKSIRGLEIELERKNKLIEKIHANLKDRDVEVRELVARVGELESNKGST